MFMMDDRYDGCDDHVDGLREMLDEIMTVMTRWWLMVMGDAIVPSSICSLTKGGSCATARLWTSWVSDLFDRAALSSSAKSSIQQVNLFHVIPNLRPQRRLRWFWIDPRSRFEQGHIAGGGGRDGQKRHRLIMVEYFFINPILCYAMWTGRCTSKVQVQTSTEVICGDQQGLPTLQPASQRHGWVVSITDWGLGHLDRGIG